MPPRPAALLPALSCALLACCSAPRALPEGFAELARQAPQDTQVRIRVLGSRIVAVAVPVGPGGLPGPVRVAADAIAPGGQTTFQGREWGPRGEGYRIERILKQDGAERFCSMLLDEGGQVLERSHELTVRETPEAVLVAATQEGRTDVRRVEVVSGASTEEGYRATVADRAGRTFVIECNLAGRVTAALRTLPSTTLVH